MQVWSKSATIGEIKLSMHRLQRPDYYPLIGHNPGLLLVFLPDTAP